AAGRLDAVMRRGRFARLVGGLLVGGLLFRGLFFALLFRRLFFGGLVGRLFFLRLLFRPLLCLRPSFAAGCARLVRLGGGLRVRFVVARGRGRRREQQDGGERPQPSGAVLPDHRQASPCGPIIVRPGTYCVDKIDETLIEAKRGDVETSG